MEMKAKIADRLKRVALSCGSFTTAYAAAIALFSVPYVYSYGGVAVAAMLPVSFLVPLIIMPIVYAVMHRSSPLLFGRYHLFMPVSAFAAALFFVIAFSSTDKSIVGAASIFCGMTLFVVALLIYRYCMFSVAARLYGDNIAKPRAPSAVCAIVGATVGVGAVYGFYRYDPTTMYSNSALTIAALCVIFAFIGYLATFNDVPVLGGKHSLRIKSAFVAFYGGIDKRAYFSSLTSVAAFLTVCAAAAVYAVEVSDIGVAFIVVCALVAAFSAVYFIAARLVKRRSITAVALAAICIAFSAALFGAASYLYSVAFVVSAAALGGAGGALAFRCMGIRFLAIKPRVTSGVAFNLLSVTVCATFAVALAVAAVAVNVTNGFLYGFGFAFVAAVVGLALAPPRKKSAKAEKRAETEACISAPGQNNFQDENPSEKENV